MSTQNSPLSSISKVIVVAIGLLLSFLFVIYYWAGNGLTIALEGLPIPLSLSAEDYLNFSLIYFSVITFFSVILLYIRARTTEKGTAIRKIYFGLLIAVFFYFLGEFSYYVQSLYIPVEDFPYPSISDLFWAIGTILLIEELISIVSAIDIKYTKKELTFILSLTVITVLSLIYVGFWDLLTASYDPDPDFLYTPFMKAMDVFYFTGDALILFATIYIGYGIFSISSEKLARVEFAWFFLVLGNISMIVGDTLYSFFEWNGGDFIISFPISFVLGNGDFRFDDMLYMGQYLFWLISFALFPHYLYKEQEIMESEQFPTKKSPVLPPNEPVVEGSSVDSLTTNAESPNGEVVKTDKVEQDNPNLEEENNEEYKTDTQEES